MLRVGLCLAALAATALAQSSPLPMASTDETPGLPTETEGPEAEPTPSPPPLKPLTPATCGRTFDLRSETAVERMEGYFHSPNFPLAYPSNTSCLWIIRGPPGHRVKLALRAVETELNYDNLTLHAGPEARDDSRVLSLSGQDYARTIVFGGNEASVRFVSDAYVVGRGFLATFRLLPASEEAALVGASGSVLSPAFPATFLPSAPLAQPNQPSLALELADAFAPRFRILNQNASNLNIQTFTFNVSRGDGMYIRFPETSLPVGGSIELLDVAEHCDTDSPRQLAINGSDVSGTMYSECSSVRVSVFLPPGSQSRFRVDYVEVCRRWQCAPEYYLGRWAAVTLNLLFFGLLVSLLACCCCVCERACRSTSPDGRRRYRRPCRPAFANPAYEEEAPPLPDKRPPNP